MAYGDPINIDPMSLSNRAYRAPSRSKIKRSQLLAQALQQSAIDSSPKGHWTQVLGQIAQGAAGGYLQNQSNKMEDERRQAMSDILGGTSTPDELMKAGITDDMPELEEYGQFQAQQANRQAEQDYRTGRDTISDEHWQKDFAADEAYRNRPEKEQLYRVGNDLVTGTGEVRYKGDPKPTKLTADQANAAGYYDRAVASDAILGDPKIEQAALSLQSNAASNIPLVGNFLTGKDFQQYDQARRDFVNAVLRKESGAAISPSEFQNASIQYFPQPGDTADTIKQKAANRKNTINALKRSSGSAFDNSGGGGDPLDEARQAIQNGADPEAVKQRLIDNGIDPSGLD